MGDSCRYIFVTGGGLIENTNRVLTDGLKLDINWSSWERPDLFKIIQEIGDVPEDDMRRTFNCGIGMVIIISKNYFDQFTTNLDELNERWYLLGTVI